MVGDADRGATPATLQWPVMADDRAHLAPHQQRALLALLVAIVDQSPFAGDAKQLPIELIRHHLLAPLAFSVGVTALRNDYIASSLLVEHRDALIAEVHTALAAAKIDAILLKGAAYAGSLYPDAAHRPMSDIDVLVRAHRHKEAQLALRRLGFWHVGPGFQHSPRHHAVGMKRRNGAVDLHRHIMQGGRTRIALEDVWSRAITSHHAHALRMEPIDEVLFHLAHIARHEFIVPLISYIDAMRLLARLSPTDRNKLTQRAAEWGLSHVLSISRRCLVRLFEGARGIDQAYFADATPAPWWLPSQVELLQQQRGSRLLEVTRKILVNDDLRSVWGLAQSTLVGRLDALRYRTKR